MASGMSGRRNVDAFHIVGIYRLGDGLACSLWLTQRRTAWEVAGVTVHAERDVMYAGPMILRPDGRPFDVVSVSVDPTTRDLAADATEAPPPAVTSRLLRDLPLGAIADDLRNRLRAEGFDDVADYFRMASVERRPGRRRQPDEFYAQVAAAYIRALEAGSRSPARDIAEAESYSVSQVNNWIHEARRRELLTSAPPGRAGGELTVRARELLAKEADQ